MNTFLKSFWWGSGRGIGNTLQKRITEKIDKTFLNPTSKLRKKIDRFDMGGDFNSAKKKLFVLLDTFHEEYVFNKKELPTFQTDTYLSADIDYIENKIKVIKLLMTDEDNQSHHYQAILNYWKLIKSNL